jgi:hypothetical protein
VIHLVIEIALRLIKPVAASLLGLLVYVLATGPFGATASVELGLLSWIAGAAFVLMVESSPI